MNEPTPWKQDPAVPPPEPLAELLEEGRRLKPFQPAAQARVWRDIERRRAVSVSFGWRQAAPWALATALAVLVVLARLPGHAPERSAGMLQVDLGEVGQLEATPGSVLHLPPPSMSPRDGYRLSLESGRVCAHVAHRDLAREGPFVVEAPRLRVIVVGTRFCVEAGPAWTTVSVSEGKVRVERPHVADFFVAAGQSFRSDAPGEAVAPVPVVGTPARTAIPESPRVRTPARCPDEPNPVRRAECYAALATGDGLPAQNALFALAQLRRNELHDGPAAVVLLHNYLARFPEGVLAPEARQTLIAELAEEHRSDEALAEAERYLDGAAWDGRAAAVALLRANLLRQSGGRNAEALAVYRQILARGAPPEVRDDALFGAAASALDLGETAAGRADLERYLHEIPAGKHAGEARTLLAGEKL
jgi:hypothetical protein